MPQAGHTPRDTIQPLGDGEATRDSGSYLREVLLNREGKLPLPFDGLPRGAATGLRGGR